MLGWAALGVLVIVALLVGCVCVFAMRKPKAAKQGGLCRCLPQPPLIDLTCPKQCDKTCIEIVQTKHKFSECAPLTTVFATKGYSSYGLPFFRFRRGTKPHLSIQNRTGYSFNLHWHGLNTTADVDGASGQVVFGAGTKLGTNLVLDFPTINNNSCLLWVHAHPMFRSNPFIYEGVFGLLDIVDDASRCMQEWFHYPDNRIVLAYQDLDVDCCGKQTPSNLYTDEARSCYGAINGVACVNWFSDKVKGDVHRLTHSSSSNLVKIDLLNAVSSFRYIHLGVCDCKGCVKSFYLVQTDTGLQNPVRLKMITLAPANRASLLIDLDEFAGSDARVFFYNYDLTEVFDVEPAQGSIDPTNLVGLVPDSNQSCNPTPNPTPIPDPNQLNPQQDYTMLKCPKVQLIPQTAVNLPNGSLPPPTSSKVLMKQFLRVSRHCCNGSFSNQKCLKRAIEAIRQIVFGQSNFRMYKQVISEPGFEYKMGTDYLALLNPKYFYNLPEHDGSVPTRNFILFGDDNENSIPFAPLGSTEYVNSQNRIFVDLWNSNELDLAAAIAAYNITPNNYQPPLLPTLLFKIYPTVEQPMNYAMLSNDTLTVQLFPNPIAYGDTTTVPLAEATVVFPPTNDNQKPLNINQWKSLVLSSFATTNIVIANVPTPLNTILSAFDWSFFPFSIAYLTGQTAVIKSVILKTTNASPNYYVRLKGAWNLLQFFGKPIAANMPPTMPGMHSCSTCKCGDSCNCTKEKKCSPSCTCWKKKKGCCKNKDVLKQQLYPQYATSDPNMAIFLLPTADDMNPLAELIIPPQTTYLGFVDGFQSDTLQNFSVLLNSSEKWIYQNLDGQDAHPLHFHLTSGYVAPSAPENSQGLVSQSRAYWPYLYSRDTYGIGPQQTIAYYVKFANYLSAQSAPSPNVPNLGFMYHCHYLTHHDMAMMGAYFVFDDRASYF